MKVLILVLAISCVAKADLTCEDKLHDCESQNKMWQNDFRNLEAVYKECDKNNHRRDCVKTCTDKFPRHKFKTCFDLCMKVDDND